MLCFEVSFSFVCLRAACLLTEQGCFSVLLLFYTKHLALEPDGLGVGSDLSVETETFGKVLTDEHSTG